MNKKFNLSRYKKLLELSRSGRISFLDSNYIELVKSSLSVGYQIIYERKIIFFSLIDNYLYGTLSLLEFRTQFLEMEEVLNQEIFQTYTFPLHTFAENIGFNQQNYTYYQRQKLIFFFQQLSKISLTQWFSDDEFKSVLVFPVTRVTYEQPNNKYTKLIVKISIAKDFISTWHYPFYFPKNFYSYLNQDDLRVKLEILKTIASQHSIQKEFNISNFLKSLPTMSNQRIKAIKNNIIYLFKSLQKEYFIEAELKLYQNDNMTIKVNQLTLSQVNRTKTIIFYETTKFFK